MMDLRRHIYTEADGWVDLASEPTGGSARGLPASGGDANLVFVFGATRLMADGGACAAIRAAYPNAHLCGCSTAGEIAGRRVREDSVTATAVRFDDTTVRAAEVAVTDPSQSRSAGRALATALPAAGLVHAFVLSDGLSVNGSELVEGITGGLPAGVTVTGGLSGDGSRFGETYVCTGGPAARRRVAVLGFYGSRLRVGYGSMGGWDPFGTERQVTRSRGNVLYELDGRSALELYREYLGPHAADLPGSGLRFPLAVRGGADDTCPVVRTILGIDDAAGSLTFAGDVPEGALARLMRANIDRLVDGAAGAARACHPGGRTGGATAAVDLAVLISCVGRKLVLNQRVEEEVEAVADVFGDATVTTGFYSYGEISPGAAGTRSALHNQTMTVTTFTEL